MSNQLSKNVAVRFLKAYETIKIVHQINDLELQLGNKQKPEISEEAIEEMVECYKISPTWLLTGRGSMFNFETITFTTNHYHIEGNAVIKSTARNIIQKQE